MIKRITKQLVLYLKEIIALMKTSVHLQNAFLFSGLKINEDVKNIMQTRTNNIYKTFPQLTTVYSLIWSNVLTLGTVFHRWTVSIIDKLATLPSRFQDNEWSDTSCLSTYYLPDLVWSLPPFIPPPLQTWIDKLTTQPSMLQDNNMEGSVESNWHIKAFQQTEGVKPRFEYYYTSDSEPVFWTACRIVFDWKFICRWQLNMVNWQFNGREIPPPPLLMWVSVMLFAYG